MKPTPAQFEKFKLVTKFEQEGYTHTITDRSGGPVRYESWTRDGTLGQGAYGTVYKEVCIANGGVRAVKQIKGSSVRWDEIAVLARLRSVILLALQKYAELHSPRRQYPEHFVQLIGWFEDGKHIYLAMEYLPCDLTTLLSDRSLSEDDAKSITKQILMGLEIMHKKKICHRDVKPSNILIAQRQPLLIKIADFGVSKHFDNTECRTELGTSCFMAPEILGLCGETSVYTTAVDIWSLGCLVHFMIAGALPFPATRDLVVFMGGRNLFTPSTAVARTILCPAIDFIASMLRQLPEDRPSALKARLSPWLLMEEPHDTIQTHVLPDLNKSTSGPEPTQMAGATNDIVPTSAKRKLAPYLLDTPGANKQPQASSLVRQRGSIQYLLVTASESGNCKALIEALGNGATPMEDPLGYTPIYRAAKKGHLPIIKLLLKHGAHLRVWGKLEVSALHGAASGGNIQIIQYLVGLGADVSATNKDGLMAHHIAAQFGATEVLQLLVERGADISAREASKNRWTALMYAAWKGHWNAACYLLDRGADISAVEVKGRMAHHIAAQFGATEVLQLLVERGADISAREASEDRWTALMYAAWSGRLNAVRYLLERGASASETIAGVTAMSLAAKNGHTEIVVLLSDWYGKDTNITLTERDYFRLSTEDHTQTTSENGSMTLWDSRA